jgi:hypothetical protein
MIVLRGRFEPGRVACRVFWNGDYDGNVGMTHDVKNSKTGKNGAATEVFQLMTFLPR